MRNAELTGSRITPFLRVALLALLVVGMVLVNVRVDRRMKDLDRHAPCVAGQETACRHGFVNWTKPVAAASVE